MSLRLPALCLAPVLLAIALSATAATHHRSRHHTAHRASHQAGPALIVRGDQVSTEGLVDAVSEAFAATGDGHLEVTPFNTVDGLDQALSGSVDIAAVARPAAHSRAQEAGLTFTPVAWDGLALVTNAANPVSNLTLKQVYDIYYGKITNWSQVGGPDQPIDLDGVASPLDGIQFSFRRLLFGNGESNVAVPRLFINIDSLQQEISLDRKALGLSTLAHARHQSGIKVLSIEGVTPSVATLRSGAYALPVRIYLAYKPDSPKLALIQKFLAFLATPKAADILGAHDLLPDSAATVLNAKSEMDLLNNVGAHLVAEGLPASYAPGTQFARIAGNPQDVAKTAALQRAAANVVAQQKAAAAAAAASAPQPAAAAPSAEYTVVSGDTLSKIAHRRGTSVADLRRWNGLHSDRLRVGQKLKVSAN